LIETSQNEKKNINSHSKFVIKTQYMMYYEIINPNEDFFKKKP
jgi:hypothetical protein